MNGGRCFLVVRIERRRKEFGMVKDKEVFVVEIVEYMVEIEMLNLWG